MSAALGYCRPQSVRAGETVEVHVSADRPVDVEVVRDGAAPEAVFRAAAVDADVREPRETGCGWPISLTITTGDTWRSGLYLVRLHRAGEPEADPPTAWFVVRAPQPASGCLFVLATNTWNAYNDVGGRNYYTGATVLSYERPLPFGMLAKPSGHGERLVDGGRIYMEYAAAHGLSTWHGMAGWAGQERRFACWAERSGIELDYATNFDVHADPSLLEGHRLFLSVGHDEYWSWPMRDHVERFISDGGNAAFLSGNTCYWQIRYEGSQMACFKHRFEEDPVYGTEDAHLTTTMWADPLVGRPEAQLTGVSFTRGGYHRIHRSVRAGTGGYEVHRPAHPLFAGTRLERGDQLGASFTAVGYECDGCDLVLRDGLPVAAGEGGTPAGFEVLATAPATPFDKHTTPLPLAPGADHELEFHARRLLGDDSPENCDRLRNGHAVLGTYTRGGTVVTTGSTEWAYALDDPVIDRITRNIIDGLPST